MRAYGYLLRSGFNVADALAFMTVRWPRRAPTFEQLIEAVSNGTELADALHAVGFAPVVSTQVALAGATAALQTRSVPLPSTYSYFAGPGGGCGNC